MTQYCVDLDGAQRYHHTHHPGKDVIPGAKLRYTPEEIDAIVSGRSADDTPPKLPKREIETLARALLPSLEKRYATK